MAAVSTAIALVLGTLVAIALVRQRFRGRTAVDSFMVLPLTSPEVVMGASLLTLFLSMGWATGYVTIVIAHVAFQISFIALTVRARIRGFDWTLEDASLDLGAGPVRTFFKVTLPLIVPGIVAAAMLSLKNAAGRPARQRNRRTNGDLSTATRTGCRRKISVLATAVATFDKSGAADRRDPVPAQAGRHLARCRWFSCTRV